MEVQYSICVICFGSFPRSEEYDAAGSPHRLNSLLQFCKLMQENTEEADDGNAQKQRQRETLRRLQEFLSGRAVSACSYCELLLSAAISLRSLALGLEAQMLEYRRKLDEVTIRIEGTMVNSNRQCMISHLEGGSGLGASVEDETKLDSVREWIMGIGKVLRERQPPASQNSNNPNPGFNNPEDFPMPNAEQDLPMPNPEENLPMPTSEENLRMPTSEENLPRPTPEENLAMRNAEEGVNIASERVIVDEDGIPQREGMPGTAVQQVAHIWPNSQSVCNAGTQRGSPSLGNTQGRLLENSMTRFLALASLPMENGKVVLPDPVTLEVADGLVAQELPTPQEVGQQQHDKWGANEDVVVVSDSDEDNAVTPQSWELQYDFVCKAVAHIGTNSAGTPKKIGEEGEQPASLIEGQSDSQPPVLTAFRSYSGRMETPRRKRKRSEKAPKLSRQQSPIDVSRPASAPLEESDRGCQEKSVRDSAEMPEIDEHAKESKATRKTTRSKSEATIEKSEGQDNVSEISASTPSSNSIKARLKYYLPVVRLKSINITTEAHHEKESDIRKRNVPTKTKGPLHTRKMVRSKSTSHASAGSSKGKALEVLQDHKSVSKGNATEKQKVAATTNIPKGNLNSGKTENKCLICKKGFSSRSSLGRHSKRVKCEAIDVDKERSAKEHLVEKPKNAPRTTAPQLYTCVFCDKRFGKKYTLNMHILTHLDERTFSCEVCEKEFKQRDKLKKHACSKSGASPQERE